MMKNRSEKTSSHSDLSNETIYKPLYYNGEVAAVGDLVKYHNLIDIARGFEFSDQLEDELYLLADISEELVGTRNDTDDPMHSVEDYRWLADIRNNRNSHIVNLSYLVKVKGE